MTSSIENIFNKDDKLSEPTVNLGNYLFGSISNALGVYYPKWEEQLSNYLDKSVRGKKNSTKRASEKNNICRSLTTDNITWKSFRRYISILDPKEVKYTVNIKWDENIEFPKPPPSQVTLTSHESSDDLYRIFKKIFSDVVDGVYVWELLVNRYIDGLGGDLSENPVDRSTEKGNIQKSIIRKNSLTVPLFYKALKILGVTNIELSIDLTWKSNLTTVHKCNIDIVNGVVDE